MAASGSSDCAVARQDGPEAKWAKLGRKWTFASRPGQRPGSVRYDEPVSCVIFIKGEQFGVAALPLAGFKVPLQILQSCFGVADGPEGRTAGSDACIKIGRRPAPVGVEESIAAIVRHQDRCDL